MTVFENVLLCILIPITLVLMYIAGKHDMLGLMCNILEEKTKELNERKNNKYSFLRDGKWLLEKADREGHLSDYEFSILMQYFLISEGGWVIDTGGNEDVNAEVALRLVQRIKDDPEKWKKFMVA